MSNEDKYKRAQQIKPHLKLPCQFHKTDNQKDRFGIIRIHVASKISVDDCGID